MRPTGERLNESDAWQNGHVRPARQPIQCPVSTPDVDAIAGIPRRIEWGAAIVASSLSATHPTRASRRGHWPVLRPCCLHPARTSNSRTNHSESMCLVTGPLSAFSTQYSALSTDRYPGPYAVCACTPASGLPSVNPSTEPTQQPRPPLV